MIRKQILFHNTAYSFSAGGKGPRINIKMFVVSRIESVFQMQSQFRASLMMINRFIILANAKFLARVVAFCVGTTVPGIIFFSLFFLMLLYFNSMGLGWKYSAQQCVPGSLFWH